MTGKKNARNGHDEKPTTVQPFKSLKLFSENYPSFIVYVKRDHIVNNIQKLPNNIILECRNRIPNNIRLQLPNGHEIHAYFNKSKKSITNLTSLIKECKRLFGSLLIYSYKGNGIFSIHIFKEDLCEVDYYRSRTIPRAPVLSQDNLTGIGWKFLLIVNNPIILSGEITIPRSFWRRFGNLLPEKVTLILRNGTVFEGSTSLINKRMFGFLHLTESGIVKNHDTLLFTYFGEGKFEVLIFQKSDIENCLHEESDSSDSETESGIDVWELSEHDSDDDVYMVSGNMGHNPLENVETTMTFSAVMKQSNINSSTHGSYIPDNIVPANRSWVAGEKVTFRTPIGEWEILISMCNVVPRFSGGWNSFSRDNAVVLNEHLVFTMLEEEDGIVFLVAFPDRD